MAHLRVISRGKYLSCEEHQPVDYAEETENIGRLVVMADYQSSK